MKKFLFFLSITICNLFYCQQEVLESYPAGQFFYIGGPNALHKQMIQIVKDKSLMLCPKTDEVYTMKILVNPDASIKYVKDFDTLNIEKNKCAFNFGRKLVPYLKNWKSAKEGDKFVGAIITLKIDPFFLYYSKDDVKDNVSTQPIFKKGMDVFSSEVIEIFQQRIKRNEDRNSSFTFVINEKGIIEDVNIEGDYSEEDKRQLISDIKRIKGTWIPATFNGIPIKRKLRQPLIQKFEFKIEDENLNNSLKQNGFYRSH
ncbi:hypothetical protein PFY10_12520 [Chryseobacterium daecheongense]|nr:hypothetical protein PFY10_12520 [Chryseobacterium daecheongense]